MSKKLGKAALKETLWNVLESLGYTSEKYNWHDDYNSYDCYSGIEFISLKDANSSLYLVFCFSFGLDNSFPFGLRMTDVETGNRVESCSFDLSLTSCREDGASKTIQPADRTEPQIMDISHTTEVKVDVLVENDCKKEAEIMNCIVDYILCGKRQEAIVLQTRESWKPEYLKEFQVMEQLRLRLVERLWSFV